MKAFKVNIVVNPQDDQDPGLNVTNYVFTIS